MARTVPTEWSGDAERPHHDASPSRSNDLPAQFDGARLNELLETAGPVLANELLERLDEDLQAVHAAVEQTLEAPDPITLRAQMHILMSLTGEIGASGLRSMAEALSKATHGNCDASVLSALSRDTLTALDDLIAYLRAEYPALAPRRSE